MRPSFPAEDRFQPLHVQPRAGPVDQPLEDLLHLSPQMKDQVATVLDLVHRVLVAKSASLLFFQIECEAEAGAVDPTLADLAQVPYSPRVGQGVCNLGQVCGLGNDGKTVALLGEGDPILARSEE